MNNTASAPAATVPGGYKNTAAGSGSLAAGYYANAVHPNSFVWSDGSQPAGFSSSAPNTFNVLASGGAFFAGGPINGSFNGQGAVPSGGMILSSNYTDSNLMLAGYVRLGKVDLGNVWDQIAPANGLAGRIEHTAVWTGTEMIIWGGYSGSFLNTGARYNPTADEWTAVSTIGAPGARGYHTAVWTGTEMIVWGGYNGSSVLGDGWRYNPSTDSWTRVSPTGAPAPRANHTAVWTGSKMIIWGGSGSSGVGDLNDGGRYDPATDSWLAVTTTGAPTARDTHTAVWTGSQMTVWGGNGTGIVLNDGGRYDPIADNWAAVSTCGAPTARWQHTAAWTGSEMIIWGGQGNSVIFLNDGGRYNPTADSWTAVTTSGAPAGRNSHTAVWTGSEMIIWGGQGISLGYLVGLNDGGRYNPTTDGWTGVTTAGASAGRWNHTAAWTDSQMIVWGGLTVGGTTFADGGRYTPSRTLYLYQRP